MPDPLPNFQYGILAIRKALRGILEPVLDPLNVTAKRASIAFVNLRCLRRDSPLALAAMIVVVWTF